MLATEVRLLAGCWAKTLQKPLVRLVRFGESPVRFFARVSDSSFRIFGFRVQGSCTLNLAEHLSQRARCLLIKEHTLPQNREEWRGLVLPNSNFGGV